MITFRFIGFALFAILMCLSACSSGGDDPIEPTPKPEVTKSEITIDSSIISNGLSFANDGGEQTISFTTNENWTLNVANTTSGATWCTASATSGTKGSASVKFTVTENTDYEDRSVSVTIKSGTAAKTFTISQKSADALLVTTNKYEVGQEGGTIEIEVKANIDYKMEISEKAKDWITESSSRALATYKHKLDIAMNEDVEKREGEITFKSGDKVETVKVYQTGGAIILLSQDEYTVSDAGETISVEIKSNVEFGVQMPDVDWIIDESSSRGMSSHSLRYVIAPNEGYDNRSAEIIFYDKNSDLKDTLKVVQAQKDAIVISKKNISIAKEGGTIEVKVNTNVNFEVQIPSEVTWVTQTESRALTEKSIYLKIAKNTAESGRSANITIMNQDSQLSETIMITQQGNISVVTLKEAGTMKKLLGEDYLNITSLKVVGPINGDDVYYLRKMLGGSNFSQADWGKLETLDLSDARIVEGGGWYYEYSASTQYYTANDEIGKYMFYRCANLKEIELPDGATSIGDNAFENCDALTTVTIGDGVTSIGSYAFENCHALTSIDIPDGVTSIGSCAFRYCDALTTVTIGDGVTSIGSSAFQYCYSLTTVTIGDGVTSIGSSAFYYCYALTTITIGDGVTSIGSSAFGSCDALTSVYIKDLSAWCRIKFSSLSSNPMYDGAKLYLDNKELTELVIPEDITEIKKFAFRGCGSIVKVDIPDNVTSIGSYAFRYCDALTTVTIGDGVTSIGSSAFHDCDTLTTVTIGDGVTSIGNDAFDDCDALTTVTIGDGVTSIGSYAFAGCSSLTDFYCHATTPPSISSSFPTYGDKTTLHVPERCGSTYKSKWGSCFKNIVEMD